MQKISFNFIFNIYSNIINCLITSSQIAEFNSSLALQHDYYIFVKYIIINLQSFIHNLTDKQNEWIKFLNNIFTSSMIINKIIDMNYYLLLNLFTTILNIFSYILKTQIWGWIYFLSWSLRFKKSRDVYDSIFEKNEL